MISRRATVGFVCQSCRLTLASSVGSRFSLSVPRGTSRRAYTDAGSPTPNVEEEEPKRPTHGTQYRRVDAKGRNRRPHPHGTSRPGAQSEVYSSRGQRLRAGEESLSVDILGKPAHAIVMKDVGYLRKKRGISQAEAEGDADPVNLSDVLSQETGIPTSDEVLLNIDELRPIQSRSIPQKDFDSLRDVLVNGFTKAQLEAYMAHYQAEAEFSKAIPYPNNGPWVLEQWPWVPKAAAVSKASDPALDGYLHKSMSPKEQLAVRLIRGCWEVSTQEVESGQGYLDVVLREVEFSLLLAGNGRLLEGISRSLLAPGKQIELIRPERVVRIVASKAIAEVILREINNVLARLETRTIDAKLLAPECLSPLSLEEVSRITNTVVQLDPAGEKVLAHWIPDAEVTEALENTGDVVFRLLLSASGPKTHTHGKMTVLPEADAKGGRFIVDSYNKDKWSWKDRTGQWARWVTATSSQTAKPTGNELLDRIPAVFGRDIESPAAPPDQSGLSSTGWPDALQRSTRAVFGHILHRYPPKHPHKLDLTQTSIISPVIPPLSSLVFPGATQPPSPPSSTILMRFLPDPTQDPSILSSAPPLELRLDASDTEITGISSLRAIVTDATTAHDILLPSAPIDIRLSQSHFHELTGSAIASSDTDHHYPLLSFLEAADLQPSAGRLVTPARLRRVAIPVRHTAAGGGGVDAIHADYIFAGLEMHRAVAADYEGWRLVYTDVEAGQGGGRRAELALEVVPSTSTAEEGEEKVMEAEVKPEGEGDAVGVASVEKVYDMAAYLAVLSRIAVGGEFKWYGENS